MPTQSIPLQVQLDKLDKKQQEVKQNPPPEPQPIRPVDRRNQLLNAAGEWEDRKIIN